MSEKYYIKILNCSKKLPLNIFALLYNSEYVITYSLSFPNLPRLLRLTLLLEYLQKGFFRPG